MRINRRKRLKRWAVRSLRKTRQSGGFFPLLAPLIPYAVAAMTGAATSAGGWGMSKLLHGIDNRRPKAERIRIRQQRRSARQSRRASRRK